MPNQKILIADDEPDIADVIGAVAEDLGFDVTVVHEGDQVVSRVSALNPAVIVLDLRMPGADGVEILRELAEMDCRAQIVLISGLDQRTLNSVESLGREKNLNIAGSLSKPMFPADIEGMLQPLLEAGPETPADAPAPAKKDRPVLGPQVEFEPHQAISEAASGKQRIVIEGRWVLDNGKELEGRSLSEWADETGTARGIAEMILRQGLAFRHALAERGSALEVVVKLSPRLLSDSAVADQLSGIVGEFGLPSEKFIIETSDEGVHRHQATAIEVLSRLRIKGYRIAFVTESDRDELLGLIDRLPMDEIVVDMAPLTGKKDLESDMECEFSYSSLTSMARKKGIETCAKNVSTRALLDFVQRCRFDWARGQQIGKASAVTDLATYVT